MSTEARQSQRTRILAGMVEAAVREGYGGASVSEVIARAGVSRPTFYEHFKDREACFLAAQEDLGEELLALLTPAVLRAAPQRALAAAIEALLQFAEQRPQVALLLMGETMGAGDRALERRDMLVRRIASLADDRHGCCRESDAVPDVPVVLVIAALFRLLSRLLRAGHWRVGEGAPELIEWVERYERPLSEQRHGELSPAPLTLSSSASEQFALRAPPRLPPGRPWISAAEIAENQRGRVIFATAELALELGYRQVTVEQIARKAGVARKAFYAQFADKQAAGLAVHELFFERVLSVSARAFFSCSAWPERVWAATLATAEFLAANPLIAHVGCVEYHALGRAALQRVDESIATFTLFLQEGGSQGSTSLGPLALQAIAYANFEILYLQARAGSTEQTPLVAHHAAYIALAPFMGAQAASRFIEAKVGRAASRSARN